MADVVSVVIPCYNEERFITKALDQLADQYDKELYEIIVVDGMSTDHSRQRIEEFCRKRPDLAIRLIDNPARGIPTALNLGIKSSRGNIIARMDAHAVPSSGYIRGCVDGLRQSGAGVVGMPCQVRPGTDSLMARAIAAGVSHPFGIGDAKYRLGRSGPLQEAVDTVAFACFEKSLWQELGGFNESLLANEDYEFNFRVRKSGRKVVLDRSGHCDYFARTTLKGLAQQYFRYGAWKAEMVRLHPRSIRIRQLVAPVFVLSLAGLGALSLVSSIARWLILTEISLYILIGLLAGLHATAKSKANPMVSLLMPGAFVTIHLAWGTSFLLRIVGIR